MPSYHAGFDPLSLSKPAEYLQFDVDALDQNKPQNRMGKLLGTLTVEAEAAEDSLVVRVQLLCKALIIFSDLKYPALSRAERRRWQKRCHCPHRGCLSVCARLVCAAFASRGARLGFLQINGVCAAGGSCRR